MEKDIITFDVSSKTNDVTIQNILEIKINPTFFHDICRKLTDNDTQADALYENIDAETKLAVLTEAFKNIDASGIEAFNHIGTENKTITEDIKKLDYWQLKLIAADANITVGVDAEDEITASYFGNMPDRFIIFEKDTDMIIKKNLTMNECDNFVSGYYLARKDTI